MTSLITVLHEALQDGAGAGDARYVYPEAWDGLALLETLLHEAYTRLMVSEGDARYENNNIALALRIAEVINVE